MQPQGQVNQMNINIQQTLAMLTPILNNLTQGGNITLAEAQYIGGAFQQPSQISAIQQQVASTFGNMPVTQMQLQELATRLIINAAQRIRQTQQTVMPATNYGVNGAMQMAAPVYAGPQQNGINMSGVYAAQMAPDRSTMPYPEQTPMNSTPVQQPRVAVEVSRPAPTNRPIEIDFSDDFKLLAPPKWTQVIPPADKPIPSHTIVEVVGDSYQVSCGNRTVESTMLRLETPFASAEGAIAEIAENHPELVNQEKKFAHIVSYRQLCISRTTFKHSVDLYEKCKSAMEEPSTAGILKVMHILGDRRDEHSQFLSSMVLEQFNNAASVNFMRLNEAGTGMSRLTPFESIVDLSRLVTDSGAFDDWKEPREAFALALRNCLRVSFNRIFNPDEKGYLDMSVTEDGVPLDNRARLIVLSDDRTGFRFSSGDTVESARLTPFLVMSAATNEDKIAVRDAITEKTKTIFPFLLERKILLHNLDLPPIDKKSFRAEWLHNTPEAMILYSFFDKYGSLETIDVTDLGQVHNPLMLGVSFENRLLVRRI